MAVSLPELATRVLQQLKVLGEGQTANPEDLLIAQQKVTAAHASLRKDERVRWTIATLPEAAEEPYVLMASYLAAPSFGQPQDQSWWLFGEREINALVATPQSGASVRVEYF